MLIEHQEFDRNTGPPSNEQDDVIYRYCNFADLTIYGPGFDGAVIGCTFRDIEWYWVLFNIALFSRARFDNCTFRGATFADCQLVECKFNGCHFVLDNLGGACSFKDCSFVECTFDKCEFVLDNPYGRPVFENTRWYGCTQTQCIGLKGQF
jgi:uncharacterized protein YjbI with pentapeptide repeats